MAILRARVSVEDIIAPGQIGWVYFQEGEIEIAAKVIKKRSGEIFAAVPVARRLGTAVRVVNYPRPGAWAAKSRQLIEFFREQVGEEFCREATPELPLFAGCGS